MDNQLSKKLCTNCNYQIIDDVFLKLCPRCKFKTLKNVSIDYGSINLGRIEGEKLDEIIRKCIL
jgi:Zn finger protein HypA/HybF involved in hydrogenase expression